MEATEYRWINPNEIKKPDWCLRETSRLIDQQYSDKNSETTMRHMYSRQEKKGD